MTRPRRARRIVLALAATLTLLPPAPARAWDDVGHMTVASIAWRRLSPAARARAVALLRAAPPDAGLAQLRPNSGGPEARDRALFARAATWPDLVKNRRDMPRVRRYSRLHWHYVNQYWRTDAAGRAVPVPGMTPEPENAAERIVALTAALRDARRPDADRAVDLAWLLHLVGDLHQPLHASSRVTDRSPKGDRGGNDVRVGGTTLHALWDNALDRSPGRQPGRRGGRPQGEDAKLGRADDWATRLPGSYPEGRWAAWIADTLPDRWAGESLVLAQRDVYPGVVDSMPLTPAYRAQVRRVSDPQVTLAGYRLAALLERALAGR